MTTPKDRLQTLDALRGLAALAVCAFHFIVCFTVANQFQWLNALADLGKHGVEVFFVISGFVIPQSMWAAGYRLTDFGRFMAKRMLRLYPPYVASIVVVLGLQWASGLVPGYGGERFAVRPVVWLQHLTYATDLFHQSWLTPVYWTLAIEFQFYLFVGLAFPLLAHRSAAVRNATLAALAVAPVAMAAALPADAWLRPWLPWWLAAFLPGVAAFHYRRGLIGAGTLLLWTAVAAAAMWHSRAASAEWHPKAVPAAAACVLAAAVIAWVRIGGRPLVWLGAVSYSFYLIHMPVGGKLLNLGGRFTHGPAAGFALVAAATVVSLAVAWLLYLAIERPSTRWSARVKYRRVQSPVGDLPQRRDEKALEATAVP